MTNPFILGIRIKCDTCDDTYIVGEGGKYWEVICDNPKDQNLVSARCPKCLWRERNDHNHKMG